jgi:hypothetical protein
MLLGDRYNNMSNKDTKPVTIYNEDVETLGDRDNGVVDGQGKRSLFEEHPVLVEERDLSVTANARKHWRVVLTCKPTTIL